MARASKASKNVATPMTTRSFRCQAESGSRSIRAAICSWVIAMVAAMGASFRVKWR